MRVITTAHREGFNLYGQHWLSGREHWPAGTEFYWYTEGYALPYQADEQQMIEQAGCGRTHGWIERRDVGDLADFAAWKLRHAGFVAPSWKFEVVKFANKMFAFADATRDYKGVAVWLDADCVTYRDIPPGLIEDTVKDAYIAHFGRPGRWTETGMFVVDCAHPVHAEFWQWIREVYLNDRYKPLHHWTDCFVLDAAIKVFAGKGAIKAHNLSGKWENDGHPMAKTEWGKYFDHLKGFRKELGRSDENKWREDYEAAA